VGSGGMGGERAPGEGVERVPWVDIAPERRQPLTNIDGKYLIVANFTISPFPKFLQAFNTEKKLTLFARPHTEWRPLVTLDSFLTHFHPVNCTLSALSSSNYPPMGTSIGYLSNPEVLTVAEIIGFPRMSHRSITD
jgi:hypothetical protein